MPAPLTYPGVYIEEVPSGVRTIVGVATSTTAFVGRALRGPVEEPYSIQSLADFERVFGGLWEHSTLSYAVSHYFLNGGAEALIVRVHDGARPATLLLPPAGAPLGLAAANPGEWGGGLRVSVNHQTRDTDRPLAERDLSLFNVIVQEVVPGSPGGPGSPAIPDVVLRTETFLNVSIRPEHPRFVGQVLAQESALLRRDDTVALPAARPDETPAGRPIAPSTTGSHGNPIGDADIGRGLRALERVDLFNLLCVPPRTRDLDVDPSTLDAALELCKRRRAMLLVDPPRSWTSPTAVKTALESGAFVLRDANAAVYFPRLRMADPRRENRLETFVPCGVVAGIIARTDAQRGVWKAPAGQDTVLRGVQELTYKLTDGENGLLNPLGVNCLRTFPVVGHVVWGARTLVGADRLASEWKYVPVRRLALYIEESLYRGTQWVVFEPNDEPLWSQIRLNVGAFMHGLFRQGAFAGSSPREAYLVKCDRETTTQDDVNRGIVNILVGFAPLKPAEFVVVRIQQLAGQIQA